MDMSKIVPCRICGISTESLGTQLCDRCWELERRVLAAPGLTRKILGINTMPEITVSVLHPLAMELGGPEADPKFYENYMTQLKTNQPILAGYINKQDTALARLVGLLVYLIIANQIKES